MRSLTPVEQERKLLYQHILDNPTDHPAKLIYADFLEEYGDEEEVVRAEFIRVQNELEKPFSCSSFMHTCSEFADITTMSRVGCESCRKYAKLKIREYQLVADRFMDWTYWAGWRQSSFHAVVGPKLGEREVVVKNQSLTQKFTRGFVSYCCMGVYDWEAHGPHIVAEHPIEEVRFVGRIPSHYRPSDSWSWYRNTTLDESSNIPPFLMPAEDYLTYGSQQAAINDLSIRAIRFAKGERP